MTEQTDAAPEPHVFLVDGSSFMFRAYYQSINQDPRYNARPSDGLPTGAVRLFLNKMLQFAREGAAGIMPSHLVVCFDKGSDKNPRKLLLPTYKATRSAMPDDMKPQVRLVREVVRAFGLEPVESEGIEADDLIAAYAKLALAEGRKVIVVTSDKDLMQLVGPNVRFYDFESGTKGKPGHRPERNLDVAGVMEKWEGAPPERIGDIQALIGDKIDNIDGVPGIGLKTAAQLIAEYGDLESLLARVEEIKQPKRREALMEARDRIRLNRRIVALDDDVDMPVPLSDLAMGKTDGTRLVAFTKAMELTAQTKRIAQAFGVNPDRIPADPALAAAPAEPVAVEGETPEQAAMSAEAAEARKAGFDTSKYDTIATPERLAEWMQGARAGSVLGIVVETAPDGSVTGIGLSVGTRAAGYLPLNHGETASLFGGGLAPGQVPVAKAVEILRPVLEDMSVVKVGHDLKAAMQALLRHDVRVVNYEDVQLASYVCDTGRGSHDVEALSDRYLGSIPPTLPETVGAKGKVDLAGLAPGKGTAYVARRADMVLRLWRILRPRMATEGVYDIYLRMDRPLVPIVSLMEAEGILVNRTALSTLSTDLGKGMGVLEEELYALAGERFNLNAPKAIGEILFERLGLPGGKKTPSGQWATSATLLEELADAGHAFPGKIVAWRQLSKLKSTFTDGLQKATDATTGRIHTTYQLAVTNTGRLSSIDPNLQNIPIRTEEGRKIRRAFVAERGNRLISADYSQIELRLLAHIADIPQLRQAFEDGIDVHAATASAMWGVPLEGLDPDLRRSAKTINFGIIYGISAFGLAARLGISTSEAGTFIKEYFARFPGIRDYIEDTKAKCREDGCVKTLFGRVCHFPGIRSPNMAERQGVERAAINAPIQGSAADIIKRAMIRMGEALDRASLTTRMLLQVHDELVFESPEGEVERAIPVIREVMEGAAAPDLNLAVPLVVEAASGLNWQEAH